MALTAVPAIGLGLGIPAAQVAADRGDHRHTWPTRVAGLDLPGWAGGIVRVDTSFDLQVSTPVPTPFWPRYWRCLAGLPWRRAPICPADGRQAGEACEFELPHLAGKDL